MRTLFCFCWALFTFTPNLYAQKEISYQRLVWGRYYLRVKLNDKWTIHQEMEGRQYATPWRFHHFINRTQLGYTFNSAWNANLGLVYSLQSQPQDPNIRAYKNVAELRPQVEVGNKQKLGERWQLGQRYRFDVRFFEQADHSFKFTNARFRYQAELQYKLTEQIAFKAFDEVHLNIGKSILYNVFDQNRCGVSAQWTANKYLGIEMGYVNWFQQRPSGEDFYNRDIWRLTIHHSIHL